MAGAAAAGARDTAPDRAVAEGAALQEGVRALDANLEERPADPSWFHSVSEELARAGVPKKLVVLCGSWCQTAGACPWSNSP